MANHKSIEKQTFKYISSDWALTRVFAAAALARAELGQSLTNWFNRAAGLSPVDTAHRLFLRVRCVGQWQEACRKNDFRVVEESLESLVTLIRKEARMLAADKKLASPYEALLDRHTPGLRLYHLDAWCDELEPFCKAALARRVQTDKTGPHLAMAKNDLKKISNILAQKLGLEVTLVDTPHPMTLGTHKDVRVGMRYNESNLAETALDVMHEGGHALYRANLPEGKGVAGTAMDEAMALIIENHVARTAGFSHLLHQAIENIELPSRHKDLKGSDIYADFVTTKSSTIRTAAHELRYPIDIIIRTRIERMVIDGNMPVKKIPEVFNAMFKDMTGHDVPDDRSGALQDIHWFGDQWGWFPQYLAGTLAAAQIYDAARRQNPAIAAACKKGQVGPLKDWLQDNVYAQGDSLNFLERVRKISGYRLDSDAWVDHVADRYGVPDWMRILPLPLSPGLTD